jgi:hypothetical protein
VITSVSQSNAASTSTVWRCTTRKSAATRRARRSRFVKA